MHLRGKINWENIVILFVTGLLGEAATHDIAPFLLKSNSEIKSPIVKLDVDLDVL